MISKPVGSDPHLINNKLWAGTQNVVSEPIGFTPRGYYLFNLGSNPDFKIVTVGFKPTLILGLNVFTWNGSEVVLEAKSLCTNLAGTNCMYIRIFLLTASL